MSHQIQRRLPSFQVPQFRGAIHRPGSKEMPLRLKIQTHDFLTVSLENFQTISGCSIPNSRGFIEAARGNVGRVGVVKSQTIHRIRVSFQRKQLFPGLGVENFAGAVVAAGDKAFPVFVECAVGERLFVGFELVDEFERLVRVLGHFLLESLDHGNQVMFFGKRDQGFFSEDFLDERGHVCLRRQI